MEGSSGRIAPGRSPASRRAPPQSASADAYWGRGPSACGSVGPSPCQIRFHSSIALAYCAAAAQYAKAIDEWKRIWQGEGPTLPQALGPRPQYASALADWGGARLLAGDLPGAILTLDASIQADSASPFALFLRARAKELAGQQDAALADYNLA